VIDLRSEWAAAAACQIVNLLAGDHPGGKAVLYAKVYHLIMDVMFLSGEEMSARWREPSEN
jgi:hypothetical protein